MLSVVVLACYAAAAIWLGLSAYRAEATAARGKRLAGLGLGLVGLAVHAVALWSTVLGRPSLALTAADTASLIGWVIAAIAVVASSTRPRLSGIGALLLLIAGVVAVTVTEGERTFAAARSGWELTAHIVLSTLAYGLITVGAALAVALGVLDRRLRSHRPLGWLAILSSVEALESGMFQALASGFALLSLALFSGFIFVDDLFAQHLVHKTVLSCLAWIILAVLLVGRWRFGWRGRRALNWTLGSFVLLGLAYFGTKLILEAVLGRHWG